MRHYEFIDHTADIAVRAWGDTLEEAFAEAAQAMFDVITNKAQVSSCETVSFEIESIDLEGLLVGFLSKLIVVHEVNRLVLGSFAVELAGNNRLRARVSGEKFDAARHGAGSQVKGVSYHMMEIHDGHGREPSYVRVLFDV
jgi:SHS2 domain-containing protein